MARKWWTLSAVVAGMFMLLLDVTIVNVAHPQIQKAFGASLRTCSGSSMPMRSRSRRCC